MIIVSGYQGVGKSTFAKTSHKDLYGREINSIDFESSNFDKSNPNWYKDYVEEILKIYTTRTDIDVLFISSHQSVRELLNSMKVEYLFIIPEINSKHDWTRMLAQRAQDSIGKPDYDKNIRALVSHILKYDDVVEELKYTHKTFIVSKRPYEHVNIISQPNELKYLIFRRLDLKNKG